MRIAFWCLLASWKPEIDQLYNFSKIFSDIQGISGRKTNILHLGFGPTPQRQSSAWRRLVHCTSRRDLHLSHAANHKVTVVLCYTEKYCSTVALKDDCLPWQGSSSSGKPGGHAHTVAGHRSACASLDAGRSRGPAARITYYHLLDACQLVHIATRFLRNYKMPCDAGISTSEEVKGTSMPMPPDRVV